MIEFNLRITSDSPDFKERVGIIRKFIMEQATEIDFTDIEIRITEPISPYRARYGPPLRYSAAYRPPVVPASNPASSYLVATREEAEQVISSAKDVLKEHQSITVSDVKELMGLSDTNTAVESTWGWTDLTTAEIKQVRDGWYIDFPTPNVL